MRYIRSLFSGLRAADVLRALILSWLSAVALEYFMLPGDKRSLEGLQALQAMSFNRIVLITCLLWVLLCAGGRLEGIARLQRWSLVAVVTLLGVLSLRASFTWAFLAVWGAVITATAVYARWGWDHTPEGKLTRKQGSKAWLWITGALCAVFFCFVSAWTVGRIYSFCTPTFDFGIFSQMFHNMKTTGVPVTTLERDGPLSHFAVHVSPIYYLMLPFYWLVPTPATLQVLQAAVITSAVIPLWKIAGHHGLSGKMRMGCCALLLLYPAYAGATGYDIHENCFLTPLILWLLYGIEKKQTALTAVFALLTLTVKEDAAVYVAVAAIWLLCRSAVYGAGERRGAIMGAVLLAVSAGWFFAVTGYLRNYGDGVMTYRYSNFIYDGSASLLTVVKSVILNPMKALYECVDTEKLPFIGRTLLPLLGLPLLTRRYERYILLIPYVLVNLMSDYRYQHDIFFQYTFGATAFLMYLTVVNLADLKKTGLCAAVLAVAVAVSALCFFKLVVPKAIQYPKLAVNNYDYYESVRKTLDTVPKDASVSATTFYTTYLSQREVLYDVRYSSREHLLSTQYIVLRYGANSDCRNYASQGKDNGYDNLVALLEREGYEVYAEMKNVLVIYYTP